MVLNATHNGTNTASLSPRFDHHHLFSMQPCALLFNLSVPFAYFCLNYWCLSKPGFFYVLKPIDIEANKVIS